MVAKDGELGKCRWVEHHAISNRSAMMPAIRIQTNLLALSERRLLTWLCTRLPAWVKPDQLTAVGFLGAILIASGYAFSSGQIEWLWLSIIGYCVNWFGDSLDGSLARFRKIERPDFGYFIDHSVDSFANTVMAIGLGLSPFVRLDVALFGLVGYLLLSIHTFLAARVVSEFRLSYLAAGPTEFRLILIAMTVVMLVIGPQPVCSWGFSGFDLFVGGVGVVLLSLFVVQTTKTARKLSRKG